MKHLNRKKLHRIPSDAEIATIILQLETMGRTDVRDAILFTLDTGAKLKETVSLKLTQISFARSEVAIGSNGALRTVPISEETFNVLADRCAQNIDKLYIFADNSRDVNLTARRMALCLRKACLRAGFTGIGFNHFRMKFVSKLMDSDVGICRRNYLLGRKCPFAALARHVCRSS